jgi:putative transposase
MKQIANNLTDPSDSFPRDKKYVLMDRDANFCAFRTILEDSGVVPVRLPTRSPDLNSHIERFHLSIKSECISRMIFFGEDMLRNAVRQYLKHYHGERNHQSLNNGSLSIFLKSPDLFLEFFHNLRMIRGNICCFARIRINLEKFAVH